jgi:hypothetical protein
VDGDLNRQSYKVRTGTLEHSLAATTVAGLVVYGQQLSCQTIIRAVIV